MLTGYHVPCMDGTDLLHAVLHDPELAGRRACALITASPGSLPPSVRSMLDAYNIPIPAKPFRLAELATVVRKCAGQG